TFLSFPRRPGLTRRHILAAGPRPEQRHGGCCLMEGASIRNPFPAYPSSWYLFCAARELRNGPLSRDLLGRRLVAFQTEGGRPVLLDARCAHLGADLGRGCVVGETLRCPFHHWAYGPDGRCTHIPAMPAVPAFARQMAYPVQERHGLVFVFNGPEPLF